MQWNMYAYEYETCFMHFGQEWWVKIHGLNEPIVPVQLDEDPEGVYYGWLGTGESVPTMIWPSWAQYSMCFPYGPKIEEEHGKGRTVRITVRKVT